jgi:hypothetical protein
MSMPFRLWVKALGKTWWACMSSAAFTVLGLCLAIFHKGEWLVTGTIIMGLLFFGFGAYRTWRDEHDRYEAETAKNAKPDIRGEAFGFQMGVKGTTQDHGESYASGQFHFTVIACNHRQVKTSIRDIALDGSLLSPPAVFSQASDTSWLAGVKPKNLEDITLDYGIHRKLSLGCSAVVEGTPTEVKLDDLIVNITDGFGASHRVQVRPGECLHF